MFVVLVVFVINIMHRGDQTINDKHHFMRLLKYIIIYSNDCTYIENIDNENNLLKSNLVLSKYL